MTTNLPIYLAAKVSVITLKTLQAGDFDTVSRSSMRPGSCELELRDPCGGGVEYLHRDPASRRRR
jgi:hypothetical protein